MEQNDTIKNLILSNFSKLRKDEFILLANMLSLEDLGALCSSSKEFSNYCRKYELFENRARKYIMDETPLAEPIYSFRDQVKLIKRGISTVYTVVFGRQETGFLDLNIIEEVKFGLPKLVERELEDNQPIKERFFEIQGLPPKGGTEVYILGNVHGEIHNFFEYLDVYASLDEITNNFEIFLQEVEPAEYFDASIPQNVLKNITSSFLDEADGIIDEARNLLKNLIKDGSSGSLILTKIILP